MEGFGLLSMLGVMPTAGIKGFRHDTWMILNPALMRIILCAYRGSSVLQTVVRNLGDETLRGGVSFSEGITDTTTTAKYTNSFGSKEQHVLVGLRRAMVYSILFGLVPVMVDSNYPDTIRVPKADSGQFVARVDTKGKVEVGWQWSHSILTGDDSHEPAKDVMVYIWNDREPYVSQSSPFDSMVLPLLDDLMREKELVQADTQAHHELSYPPFVLQENPHSKTTKSDETVNQQYLYLDMLGDPSGRNNGHGPGGTLVGGQARRNRIDEGIAIRANKSDRRADNTNTEDDLRVHVDPCTGTITQVRRTVFYHRHRYIAPAGTVVTAGFARPSLRNDLLAHRTYLSQQVASALGLPIFFVFGGNPGMGGNTQNQRNSKTGSLSSASMNQDLAKEMLRERVSAIRLELEAFYSQAAYHFFWAKEAMGLSRDVANGEAYIADSDLERSTVMARQLQLVGTSLADLWQKAHDTRLRETSQLHRATEVAELAKEIWKSDLVQQSANAILGIIPGLRKGQNTLMSLDQVNKRGLLGEGMEPADLAFLRQVDDVQGLLTQPRSGKALKPPRGKKDPNTLAEGAHDRRERMKAAGRPGPSVPGITMKIRGKEGGQSGYELRGLTEAPPTFGDALQKARELMQTQRDTIQDTDRMRRRLTEADRGKFRLIWNTPAVPDWGALRQMSVDLILKPEVYKTMLLRHHGLDPSSTASKEKPFPLERATIESLNQKRDAAVISNNSKKKTKAPAAKRARKSTASKT